MGSPSPVGAQEWMRLLEKRMRGLEQRGTRIDTIALPFAVDWGNYATSYTDCIVRRALGEVQVLGLLGRSGATIAATTAAVTIANLPEGWRPKKRVLIAGFGNSTTAAPMWYNVLTTGEITAQWATGSQNYASGFGGFYADLTPIRFIPAD